MGTPDPDVELDGLAEGAMWLEVHFAPIAHKAWHGYFRERLHEGGLDPGWVSDPSHGTEIAWASAQ